MPRPERPGRPDRPSTPAAQADEIIRHYTAALDSVALINKLTTTVPENMSPEEVVGTIARNVEHLKIMVAKPFWTTEDLAPLHAAIAAGTPAV